MMLPSHSRTASGHHATPPCGAISRTPAERTQLIAQRADHCGERGGSGRLNRQLHAIEEQPHRIYDLIVLN
jgi:hypothetical protein